MGEGHGGGRGGAAVSPPDPAPIAAAAGRSAEGLKGRDAGPLRPERRATFHPFHCTCQPSRAVQHSVLLVTPPPPTTNE